jgi:hypothetical protein
MRPDHPLERAQQKDRRRFAGKSLRPKKPDFAGEYQSLSERARFFGLRPANIVATIALGWRPD